MQEFSSITELVLQSFLIASFLALINYFIPFMGQLLRMFGRNCVVAFHHLKVDAFLAYCNELRRSSEYLIVGLCIGIYWTEMVQLAVSERRSVNRQQDLIYRKSGMLISYVTDKQRFITSGDARSFEYALANVSLSLCLLDSPNTIIWFCGRRYTARPRFAHLVVFCVTCLECAYLWLESPFHYWTVTQIAQILTSFLLLVQSLRGVKLPFTDFTFSDSVLWFLALCTFFRLLRWNYLVADCFINLYHKMNPKTEDATSSSSNRAHTMRYTPDDIQFLNESEVRLDPTATLDDAPSNLSTYNGT